MLPLHHAPMLDLFSPLSYTYALFYTLLFQVFDKAATSYSPFSPNSLTLNLMGFEQLASGIITYTKVICKVFYLKR